MQLGKRQAMLYSPMIGSVSRFSLSLQHLQNDVAEFKSAGLKVEMSCSSWQADLQMSFKAQTNMPRDTGGSVSRFCDLYPW